MIERTENEKKLVKKYFSKNMLSCWGQEQTVWEPVGKCSECGIFTHDEPFRAIEQCNYSESICENCHHAPCQGYC